MQYFFFNLNLRVGSFFFSVEIEQENIGTEIGEDCRTGKKKIRVCFFFFFEFAMLVDSRLQEEKISRNKLIVIGLKVEKLVEGMSEK